jgi:ABC-type hemin transport system substrate-binding protein
MRISRYFVALLTLSLLMLSGCGQSPTNSASTCADQSVREQDQEVLRFAVFSPAIGVMLRDLGFEDDIVGRHSYDTALSSSIPVVGSHIEIDDEVLINANPNVLIFEENSITIPQRIRDLADARGWMIWTFKLESLDDIAITLDDLYLRLVGFPEDANSDDDPLTFAVDPTKRFDIELPSARLARVWSPLGRDATSAGRTLLLAGVDPPGALGPGSFHAQMIERMGITNALTTGNMWQEMDLEDLVELAPDSILIFSPADAGSDQGIGEPEPMGWSAILAALGPIASLPLPAIEQRRVGLITHPQALLPSSTLGQVGDEVRKTLALWRERSAEP